VEMLERVATAAGVDVDEAFVLDDCCDDVDAKVHDVDVY